MKYLLPYFCSCAFFLSSAQAPLVKQWDKRFGGKVDEMFDSFEQTTDGGYILGGSSDSYISGDKTQSPWGIYDYWVVKIDATGGKQWDKRFGGTEYELLTAVQQTTDGGYILGGYSNSGISGDRTQANWDTTLTTYDYWIVKIGAMGNKQWDKRFGGTDADYMISLQQTADGGYILGGSSRSPIGGDKTQTLLDTGLLYWASDYWIVKTDSLGNKQWDKRFGGKDHDQLLSVLQTVDGGYILGGTSNSGLSGDRTEPSRGGYDYWIIKTDGHGVKQWDKRYGGAEDESFSTLIQVADGGYMLSGISNSDAGGDKTEPSRDTSSLIYYWGDYWVVKIDSTGNKQWDKRFGGALDESWYGKVYQTTDGGYLISGTSDSDAGGDKSEDNLGGGQGWVVKTDSTGNKQWDKTILTSGAGYNDYAIQIKDGCYAIANFTRADAGGYKTQPNWDSTTHSFDFWIAKFCDTTRQCSNVVSISVSGNVLSAYDGIAYQWYLNGVEIAGATTNVYVAVQGGVYSVAVTGNTGCVAVSDGIIISGIDDVGNSKQVELYPDPATSELFTTTDGIPLERINIFNAVGGLVMTFVSPTTNNPLSVAALPNGIYFAEIITGNTTVKKKWVKI